MNDLEPLLPDGVEPPVARVQARRSVQASKRLVVGLAALAGAVMVTALTVAGVDAHDEGSAHGATCGVRPSRTTLADMTGYPASPPELPANAAVYRLLAGTFGTITWKLDVASGRGETAISFAHGSGFDSSETNSPSLPGWSVAGTAAATYVFGAVPDDVSRIDARLASGAKVSACPVADPALAGERWFVVVAPTGNPIQLLTAATTSGRVVLHATDITAVPNGLNSLTPTG